MRRDAAPTHRTAIAIALAARPHGTVVTDLSAAWLTPLPLPPWLRDGPAAVSLSVPSDSSHTRRPGIRGRRLDLPPEHVTELDGIPVTIAARTWLDCAALVPAGHLVAMGDAVLNRSLASAEDLQAMCHWAFRRRGVATARRVLPLLDPRSESPGESLARFILVTGGVKRPTCNADIVVHGEWLARADMLWTEEGVVVEYDGAVHISEESRRYDAVRRNLLQEAGYYVIVITANDLRHPERLVHTVRTALRARTNR